MAPHVRVTDRPADSCSGNPCGGAPVALGTFAQRCLEEPKLCVHREHRERGVSPAGTPCPEGDEEQREARASHARQRLCEHTSWDKNVQNAGGAGPGRPVRSRSVADRGPWSAGRRFSGLFSRISSHHGFCFHGGKTRACIDPGPRAASRRIQRTLHEGTIKRVILSQMQDDWALSRLH